MRCGALCNLNCASRDDSFRLPMLSHPLYVCVFSPGWLSADPLRQRALSKQTGPLQGICYLAQNTGENTHLPLFRPRRSMRTYMCSLTLPHFLLWPQQSHSVMDLLSWQHNRKITVWSTCSSKRLVPSVLLFPTIIDALSFRIGLRSQSLYSLVTKSVNVTIKQPIIPHLW